LSYVDRFYIAVPLISGEWKFTMRKRGAEPLIGWPKRAPIFIKVTSDIDREPYFAIAEEARKLDLSLSGHLLTNDNGIGFKVGGVEASNAGQKSLEHAQGIPFPFEDKDLNLLPTLLRKGTWVVPTLSAYWAPAHVRELAKDADQDPRIKHIAPTFREFWAGQSNNFGTNNEIPLKVLQ